MRGRFRQAPLPDEARQAIASLAATRRPPFARGRRDSAGRSMQVGGPRGARTGQRMVAGGLREPAGVHDRQAAGGARSARQQEGGESLRGRGPLPAGSARSRVGVGNIGGKSARAARAAGRARMPASRCSAWQRAPPHAGARQGNAQDAQRARRPARVRGMHAGGAWQARRETRWGRPVRAAGGAGAFAGRPAVARIPGCGVGGSAAGPAAPARRQYDAAPGRRGRGGAQEKPAGDGAPRLKGMSPGGRSRGERSAKRPRSYGRAQARARRAEAALRVSHSPAAAGKTGRAARRRRACGRPPPQALRRRFPERPRPRRPRRPAASSAACAVSEAR